MKSAQYYQDSSGKQTAELADGTEIHGIYIPCTVGSDYSGSLMEKSNYEFILKNYNDYDCLYNVYGGYGTYGIFYAEKEATIEEAEAIRSLIDALEGYPLLDEELYNQMEFDVINEFLNEELKYGIREFGRMQIGKKRKEIIRDIVYQNIGNLAYTETGGIPYINWKEVKKEFDRIMKEKNHGK